jgi:hypothetical protein
VLLACADAVYILHGMRDGVVAAVWPLKVFPLRGIYKTVKTIQDSDIYKTVNGTHKTVKARLRP